MGEVYLAEDMRLGRKIALKFLSTDLTADDDRVHRFQQEARAASALNHPNILTIYDIGQIGSLHYIATEFINGITLRERIRIAKMGQEAIDVTIQVACALAAAHQAGIVHRDIKPENIMLRRDGYVKVVDFGLAKLIERQSSLRDSEAALEPLVTTKPGLVMGTPKYMSPEQVRGLEVDGRTDIFSLGVVLYEMVTGRVPFEGSTIGDVIAGILQNDPPPIAQYSANVSAELEWIVNKALTKQIQERYQTVEGLLSDLRNLSRGPSKQADSEVSSQMDLNSEATLPIGSNQRRINTANEAKSGSPSYASTILASSVGQARKIIDSLAILPLANASADPNLEYLSDGITETIINNLSKLPKLRVMARSTVFRYKGKQVDPQQVGYDLNVHAVLTGRVLLLGDRLIISTELVDVSDGSQLWGEQYDRKQSDIFAIGGEISKEISDQLRLKLTGEEQKRLTKRYTENSEAYQLYLKGRHFWNKFNSQTLNTDDVKSAEQLFGQAIIADSNFALAHSSLGVCHLNHVLKGMGGIEYYAKAKDAFDRALAIDASLVESRVMLIYIDLFEGRSEWARQEVGRLLRSAPNEPSVHAVAAYVYRLSGQYERTLGAWDHFLEISPTDVVYASYNRARVHIYQRDYVKAEAELAKGLAFESQHPTLHAYSALIDYYLGDIEKAKTVLEGIAAHKPVLHGNNLFLAYCYLVCDERERAFSLIDDQVIEIACADQDVAYRLATVYALDRNFDEAIEWLKRAIAMGNENYPWFVVDPNWQGLRGDPRYRAMMGNLKARWEKLSNKGSE
jgi:serine/threonine-protein kinase